MFKRIKSYQKLEDDIQFLEFELDRYKKELKRWVDGDLQKVKLTKDSKGAKVEESIAILEKEIAIKKQELEEMKKLIASFDGLDNQILYMKYIEKKTLEQIADELGYSASHIYNRHSQINKMIEYAKMNRSS